LSSSFPANDDHSFLGIAPNIGDGAVAIFCLAEGDGLQVDAEGVGRIAWDHFQDPYVSIWRDWVIVVFFSGKFELGFLRRASEWRRGRFLVGRFKMWLDFSRALCSFRGLHAVVLKITGVPRLRLCAGLQILRKQLKEPRK
jgi:hypothetical protein